MHLSVLTVLTYMTTLFLDDSESGYTKPLLSHDITDSIFLVKLWRSQSSGGSDFLDSSDFN